jgi:hypothetical protein
MSLPPPLTRPLDLVLHVGMGKTGTSSVQFLLRDNRDTLARLGLLYPRTPGRTRHHRLSLSVNSPEERERSPEWYREGAPDPAVFRRRFRRRLLREIERSGLSRVLFSDEVLFGSSYPTIERLGRWTSRISRRLEVLVYLRRQDAHMLSRYQQEVKIGEVRRLEDWARQDMSRLYDYHTRLRAHRRLLAPDRLTVRRYERSSFPDGSVLQDFLDAVGVDARASELEHGADRNIGLDADTVEFLRLLNLYRVSHEGATPGLIDNRAIVPVLAEAGTGTSLTLPGPVLDEFMAPWERSNELVAREFLGDRTGVLFREPRRAEGTTTEQRLDPARIPELLAVADLPDHLATPLRALAEKEAVRR